MTASYIISLVCTVSTVRAIIYWTILVQFSVILSVHLSKVLKSTNQYVIEAQTPTLIQEILQNCTNSLEIKAIYTDSPAEMNERID